MILMYQLQKKFFHSCEISRNECLGDIKELLLGIFCRTMVLWVGIYMPLFILVIHRVVHNLATEQQYVLILHSFVPSLSLKINGMTFAT